MSSTRSTITILGFLNILIRFSGTDLTLEVSESIARHNREYAAKRKRGTYDITLSGYRRQQEELPAIVGIDLDSDGIDLPILQPDNIEARIKKWSRYTELDLKLALLKQEDDYAAPSYLIKLRSSQLRSQQRYQSERNLVLEAEVQHSRADLKQLIDKEQFRKGPKGHISTTVGYGLALTRSASHASAESTALMVAGWQETKWPVL